MIFTYPRSPGWTFRMGRAKRYTAASRLTALRATRVPHQGPAQDQVCSLIGHPFTRWGALTARLRWVTIHTQALIDSLRLLLNSYGWLRSATRPNAAWPPALLSDGRPESRYAATAACGAAW